MDETWLKVCLPIALHNIVGTEWFIIPFYFIFFLLVQRRFGFGWCLHKFAVLLTRYTSCANVKEFMRKNLSGRCQIKKEHICLLDSVFRLWRFIYIALPAIKHQHQPPQDGPDGCIGVADPLCRKASRDIYGKLPVFQPKVCSMFKVPNRKFCWTQSNMRWRTETDSRLHDTLVTLNLLMIWIISMTPSSLFIDCHVRTENTETKVRSHLM